MTFDGRAAELNLIGERQNQGQVLDAIERVNKSAAAKVERASLRYEHVINRRNSQTVEAVARNRSLYFLDNFRLELRIPKKVNFVRALKDVRQAFEYGVLNSELCGV